MQQICVARRYWMPFSNVPNETSFIVQWWVTQCFTIYCFNCIDECTVHSAYQCFGSVKPINIVIQFTEDVLTDAKGECVICLEDLNAGDVIARLPCLCIYHKGWVPFEIFGNLEIPLHCNACIRLLNSVHMYKK